MKKIYNETVFTALVISSILAFPILETIGIIFKIEFFLQEEFLSFIGIIITLFALIYFDFFRVKNPTKKITLSDIFIIASFIFCIISIIFSKSIKSSLKGRYHYCESLFQVLGYFGLFFICSNISETKNKKSILTSLLILGVIEAGVAFLQYLGVWPVTSYYDPYSHTKNHLAFGFTQHCNFFAPLAIIFTALFAMKFIYSNTKKEIIYSYIFSIICCSSILFTCTRIGWVGVFAILFGIIFLEVSLLICKKDKRLFKKHLIKYIVTFCSFFVCILLIGSLTGQLKNDLTLSKKELKEISSNSNNTPQNSNNSNDSTTYNKFNSFATNRGKIWIAGFKALKKYPFTGVGFDIYSFVFLLSPQYGIIQNKGHNEYIHTLVTQGIFSGFNYIAFVFYCWFFALKKILKGNDEYSKSDTTKFFFIAVFAYFIQALFNSSVTNVAVYKWILMGLLLTRSEQKDLTPFFRKIILILNKPIKLSNHS